MAKRQIENLNEVNAKEGAKKDRQLPAGLLVNASMAIF